MRMGKKFVFFAVVLVFIFASILFPYDLILTLEDGMYVTRDELDEMLNDNFFVSTNVYPVSKTNVNENDEYTINPDDRIAQMVIARVEKAQIEVTTELADSVRGEGGFGSTGF